MNLSGILPLVLASSQVALCGIGQELSLYGMVFVNSTTNDRQVTLSLYRQATSSTQVLNFTVKANTQFPWPKTIGLQPGDYVNVYADQTNAVNLLWSLDVDTGANPVASGFNIRGAYSNTTPYNANDIVSAAGSSYVAIQPSTGKDPTQVSSSAYWLLLIDGSAIAATVANIVGGAPSSLDTLGELAAAINNDPNFWQTVNTALATKANSSALATVATSGKYSDLIDAKKRRRIRAFMYSELM